MKVYIKARFVNHAHSQDNHRLFIFVFVFHLPLLYPRQD
ncbi:unnamed protein product [Hydatigera taeniaeformis]|uniref:Uncharacterized protein n=1 Tax=Hydatigena taeniaeformis TaxID=6205 RepID=A0A0R3X7R3_HYDTA|nr:unnamed protein product [Hydatigera taeniaeformis]